MNKGLISIAALGGFMGAPPALGAVITNEPYLCFDASAIAGCGTADSPFAGGSYSYFHLETFEDRLLNTPGVTAASGTVGGTSADSVDADDGAIDGSGSNGWTYRGGGGNPAVPIVFTFDQLVLGALPTDVGIVWTDGGTRTYTFEFFDQAGGLLGSASQHLVQNGQGLTGAERFFGWTGNVGVGSIRVSGQFMEVDHLQYGLSGAPAAPVPEPSTWAMMIVGFGAVGYSLRRRRAGMRLPQAV